MSPQDDSDPRLDALLRRLFAEGGDLDVPVPPGAAARVLTATRRARRRTAAVRTASAVAVVGAAGAVAVAGGGLGDRAAETPASSPAPCPVYGYARGSDGIWRLNTLTGVPTPTGGTRNTVRPLPGPLDRPIPTPPAGCVGHVFWLWTVEVPGVPSATDPTGAPVTTAPTGTP